jgi:hypothetical protein
MAATVTIPPSLVKAIQRKAVENYKKKIFPRLRKSVNLLKIQMIEDFMSHPITKEILAGPRATNTSGTLEGYGNLFSFIGFERNSLTVEPIIDILKRIEPILDSQENVIRAELLEFPQPEEVWKVTPMPWQEGRSWARGIESGISGLNYYLFSEEGLAHSRSGTGEQMQKPISSHFRYRNTQYVTAFLKKYKALYQKLLLEVMQSFNR